MSLMRKGWRAALGAALALATPAWAYNEADLARLELSRDCYRCDLAGADLSDASLDIVIFFDAQLPGADFSRSSVTDALFDGANLRGANFRGADLSDSSFNNAILDGADLTDANVGRADFTGASLDGTRVTGTDMSLAFGADLSKVIGQTAAKPTPTPQPPAPRTLRPDLRVGSVFLVAFDYCPYGAAEAAGTTWQIQGNEILYSLYGNQYGGDGKTSFNLPDLRQQVPLAGMRFCIVTEGTYPERR